MSKLNPNYQWSEFKATIDAGRTIKPCEVWDGEKYLGTFITNNPYDSVIGGSIRNQADYLALRANSVFPQEIIPVDKFPHLTKAREALKAKRELAEV